MTTYPLVSICIPTYNGEKYIRETLDSALSQTYKEIEIIITDDNSTDNTSIICKHYADNDTRIHFYKNKKNLGLVENWKQSINKSNAKWIKFLFQDDLISPDCIEKMIKPALEYNLNFILCNRTYLFENEVSNKTKKLYNNIVKTDSIFKKDKIYKPDETASLISNHFFTNCLGEPPCILFNKEEYQPKDFTHEFIQIIDYVFVLNKILKDNFYYIREPLISFRVHYSSETFNNSNIQSETKKSIQKKIHIIFYERIKLCYLLLTNPIYKNVKNKIGKKKILRIQQILITNSYYRNRKNIKWVLDFYNNTELKTLIKPPKKYLLKIQYKTNKRFYKKLKKKFHI